MNNLCRALTNYVICWKGFFVVNHKSLATSQHPIGQMWKEYALSDSRYLTGDVFVLCVEALTAV